MDEMTRREAIQKGAAVLAAAAAGVAAAATATAAAPHPHRGNGACKLCDCPGFKPNRIGHCINNGSSGRCGHVSSEHQ